MKLTRRQLAAAAFAPAALTEAQTAPPADDLQAAKERVRNTANALSAVPLPMATEPAAVFKVL
jgi:hypothetical protein